MGQWPAYVENSNKQHRHIGQKSPLQVAQNNMLYVCYKVKVV